MGHIFRIECTKCNQFMRYDRQYYEQFDQMHWTCWDCGYQIVTSCLADTVELVKEEE